MEGPDQGGAGSEGPEGALWHPTLGLLSLQTPSGVSVPSGSHYSQVGGYCPQGASSGNPHLPVMGKFSVSRAPHTHITYLTPTATLGSEYYYSPGKEEETETPRGQMSLAQGHCGSGQTSRRSLPCLSGYTSPCDEVLPRELPSGKTGWHKDGQQRTEGREFEAHLQATTLAMTPVPPVTSFLGRVSSAHCPPHSTGLGPGTRISPSPRGHRGQHMSLRPFGRLLCWEGEGERRSGDCSGWFFLPTLGTGLAFKSLLCGETFGGPNMFPWNTGSFPPGQGRGWEGRGRGTGVLRPEGSCPERFYVLHRGLAPPMLTPGADPWSSPAHRGLQKRPATSPCSSHQSSLADAPSQIFCSFQGSFPLTLSS